MLKTVKLYGHLGRRFGKVHRLDVADARDAVRALSALHKGFQQALVEHRGGYRVILDNTPMHDRLELQLPSREIKFVPVVAGAGHGLGEVILGAALVVASFYIPGAQGLAATYLGASEGVASALGGMALSMGMTMVMTGIAQALSQPPQTQYSNSFSFSGPVNTTSQGSPVPVLYGRAIVGSFIASASLQAYDIAIGSPTTNTGSTSTVLANGTIETTNSSTYKGVF